MKNISDVLREKYISHFAGNQVNIPEKIIINIEKLKGTAFFPGGDGLYKENSRTRKSFPIMVLGQDFDNQDNFERLKDSVHQSEIIGSKKPNKTWQKLLGESKKTNKRNGILLNDDYKININPTDCFFTNIIMGLRKGNEKNHSKSIAFNKSNEDFFMKNIEFFKQQIDEVKPKLIIGLGAQIPKFIGCCFNEQENISPLSKINSFKELDALGNHTNIYEIQPKYLSYSELPLFIVFITHPSYYDRNSPRRLINIERNTELDSISRCLKLINYYNN